MNIDRVDLNQLIIQVADLYPRQDGHLNLTLLLDHELPDIYADAVMIRQVMHNLIRNAMEAMERQPDADIQVATRQITDEKKDMIEVSVTDDGPGFRSEALDEIFEPYVTTKPKGTGLGLAIVKKLIEEHGGKIWIESTSAAGACVRFQLPVTETASISSIGIASVERKHG
jgi:nitrogen fixation/metabolism regulation signal transduction histidine kinase